MGAVTPGETLGTLYNIHVGSNKTKATHTHRQEYVDGKNMLKKTGKNMLKKNKKKTNKKKLWENGRVAQSRPC